MATESTESTQVNPLLNVFSSIGINGRSYDFLGKGHIWIEDDYDASSIRLVRLILQQAIRNTAPGQLRIVGFDENLYGVFAPFAALTEGQSSIIELIEERADLKKQVAYLKHHARSVQNAIRGLDSSLFEYRASINQPVEQYHLVVLSMDLLGAKQIDAAFEQDIMRLLRVGPAAGISFLIMGDIPSENMQRMYPGNISFIDMRTAKPVDSYTMRETAKAIVNSCADYIEHQRKDGTTNLQTVRFFDVHKGESWQKSSADGLDITVGRYGDQVQTVTIGDELNQRHNILITGAVGQGKSNLISVMVHSLCFNYSPEELRLYLLDFKEGVTFKPYANVGREEYLPHAQTIGLESDVEFGIAVFEELHEEYLRRMRLFKRHDVRSLYEYRQQRAENKLARIVVVIDEFQLMFGSGQQAAEVANMLESAVRLYRAAGIHFVLSSQTLDGSTQFNTRRDAIFGQVPIRIALKNSLTESYRTLATDNPAAAYLRPREAIINEDYGVIAHNKKATIAYADEGILKNWRDDWWRRSHTEQPAPYVYDSEHRASLSEDVKAFAALSEPSIILGQRVSISSQVMELPLANDPGCNVAILGAQSKKGETGYGILQAAAVSLALSTKSPANFCFCEFKASQPEWPDRYPWLMTTLRNLGHTVTPVTRDNFDTVLNGLMSETEQQVPTYVIASNLDSYVSEGGIDGGFGVSYGPSPLVAFTKKGPSRGMHLIGWWVRTANFESQLTGMDSSDPFNTKVFLRVDSRDVQRYAGVGEQWKSSDNRALAIDRVELVGNMPFVPYGSMGEKDRAALENLASARR